MGEFVIRPFPRVPGECKVSICQTGQQQQQEKLGLLNPLGHKVTVPAKDNNWQKCYLVTSVSLRSDDVREHITPCFSKGEGAKLWLPGCSRPSHWRLGPMQRGLPMPWAGIQDLGAAMAGPSGSCHQQHHGGGKLLLQLPGVSSVLKHAH
ncbi:hypothetical protein Anapl_08854 [Anas platyrhynchos]|uniref:Uncharacterized protein n=1 Tax=Anas platyrhynchos TaxID=8839 RepID=R0JPM0_ANAPL|nr:hypothetical protein Anapl_08854 [Anas platyrhynchos]